ncbi:VWA domain-containing protein [Ideonella sp. 4Y16]|uniref:vWA domain-containing protein n=1 Tax=Ideonella alba TaxID=2824118 RepID=UPI001B3836EF|nr:vWA domain-containing protein [Ideonella alba]MBQ0942046.1 VWA domain-containing protein [Ideonella alba]
MSALDWLGFVHPGWLWALPLALLPWGVPGAAVLRPLRFAHLALWPADAASRALALALRAASSLGLAAMLLALAQPYRPAYEVQREGRGAEIVLLLDRSRSMDQSPMGSTGPMAGYTPTYGVTARHSAEERLTKAQLARRELSAFAARRPQDRFAMMVFSSRPLKVLGFTEKPAAIQAAIEAGAIGRGIGNTDIGAAVLGGLSLFEQRAYTGSRVLMLVSDGGDHLEVETRDAIAQALARHRVRLVWIYLRAPQSPGLEVEPGSDAEAANTVPEVFLHRFFRSLKTPYKAYEAGSPEALQQAIADVERLENLPITTTDTVPRRDLTGACLGLALACALALGWAARKELPAWA